MVHSPVGIISGFVRNSLSKQRAALCFTVSKVSLICKYLIKKKHLLKTHKSYLPGDQKLWYVLGEGICHFFIANVGYALQGQINEDRIPGRDVVLDILNNKSHQVALVI